MDKEQEKYDEVKYDIWVKSLGINLHSAINDLVDIRNMFAGGMHIKNIRDRLATSIESGNISEWIGYTDDGDFPGTAVGFEEEFGETAEVYLEGLPKVDMPTATHLDAFAQTIDLPLHNEAADAVGTAIRRLVNLCQAVHTGSVYPPINEYDIEEALGSIYRANDLLDNMVEEA